MLTKKQNMLETMKQGGRPDRLVNQYEALAIIRCDPLTTYTRANEKRGTCSKDRWGTTILFPEKQFSAMPHITDENKVCPDVTEWRKYVKIPDIEENCRDWSAAREMIASVDRREQLVMGYMARGIFEQLHFLLGFEDTLLNLILEPEAMEELIGAIAEYKYTYAQMLCENMDLDILLSHDDWGAKDRMFFSPQIWREMIKPHWKRIYGMVQNHGVKVIHHADSFLEPIAEEMPEIHVDIWQGVLPQNNIQEIGKKLNGKMVLMGGIDAAIVDRADATEEEIRKEVQRACREYGTIPGFIPCMTYGLPGSIFEKTSQIVADEIDCYNREHFGISSMR